MRPESATLAKGPFHRPQTGSERRHAGYHVHAVQRLSDEARENFSSDGVSIFITIDSTIQELTLLLKQWHLQEVQYEAPCCVKATTTYGVAVLEASLVISVAGKGFSPTQLNRRDLLIWPCWT